MYEARDKAFVDWSNEYIKAPGNEGKWDSITGLANDAFNAGWAARKKETMLLSGGRIAEEIPGYVEKMDIKYK